MSSDPEISASEVVNVSNDESEKLVFTDVERVLAALLGICLYTLVWMGVMLLGVVIKHTGLFLLVVILLFVIGKMPSGTLRVRLSEALLILSVVMATQFAVAYLEINALLFAAILFGGVGMGIFRHKLFQPYMKRRWIKYGFSLLFILGIPIAAFSLASIYFLLATLIDIPIEYVRAPKVAPGWILSDEQRSIRVTKATYQKGNSSLTIHADRLAQPQFNRDWYRDLYQRFSGGELTHQDTLEIHGAPGYSFHLESAEGLSVMYFWYCEFLQSNFYAVANLVDGNPSQYQSEVEDMVMSFSCPIPR